MLQTSSLLADSLADRLVSTFIRSYGKAAPTPYAEILGEASRLVIERLRLGLTDALDFKPRPRWPLDSSIAVRV